MHKIEGVKERGGGGQQKKKWTSGLCSGGGGGGGLGAHPSHPPPYGPDP